MRVKGQSRPIYLMQPSFLWFNVKKEKAHIPEHATIQKRMRECNKFVRTCLNHIHIFKSTNIAARAHESVTTKAELQGNPE